MDPRKGPLGAIINPRPPLNLPPKNIILGRVVDASQQPVSNSIVSVNSIRTGNTTSGRTPEGTDPLAVTDAQGEIFISSRETFDSMELEVEARGYARKHFMDIAGGPKRQDLEVTEGAYLNGRVIHEGKPVSGITIGVVSVDRGIGSFTGEFVIGTAEDGTFQIRNLPPNREYVVYGHMSPLQRIGVVPVRRFSNQADGSTTNIGDLIVVNGYRLAGQVKLSDNKPIPANTRMLIGRRDAWDSLVIDLPADGLFDVNHLPPESLSVGVRIKGYRHSARNASLDRLNPFGLVGRLEADKTNFTILLEPGNDLPSEFSGGSMEDMPENRPLYGIEERPANPNAFIISGRVLDGESQIPLTGFHITPGRSAGPMSDRIQWISSIPVTETNGSFIIQFEKRIENMALKAEADGYLPALTNLSSGQTNCEFRLKKGFGPSGVLLLPDGKPAVGVAIYYLGAQEQIGIAEKGKLMLYSREPRSQTLTDDQGRFQFAPKLGYGEIIASYDTGFARSVVEKLPAQVEIKLQPWASVHGRLLKEGKPIAGEDIDVIFAGGYNPKRPSIHLRGSRTDEEGRFKIEYLPAGNLQLCTRQYMGTGMNRGWTNQRQREFTAKAGEDMDLGDVEKSN